MTVLAASFEAPAFELPRFGRLVRHAVPRVIEGMILPVAVFYVGMIVSGVTGGIVLAVAWVYAGVAWRLARRRAVPGALLLAAGTVTVRAVLALLSGSAVIFFLQPTLGVFCASAGFLATVRVRRPLVRRVAEDLVPLPEHVTEHAVMRSFYTRQSLLWGCAQFGNASLSLWLLLSQSLQTYLIVRTSAVAVLLSAAALLTLVDFRLSLRALRTS
ncbi:VC0807 family protein [Nonomuraea rhizosphaerae]|uniref:VC0807 family protein n=1 Tax=Nonomuraea rhizosphaerae TaxID=2665663 RepID=UPI001C5EA6A6|nr:VC0807 family protein [Nonomuraea rhizosphaerae]